MMGFKLKDSYQDSIFQIIQISLVYTVNKSYNNACACNKLMAVVLRSVLIANCQEDSRNSK